MTLKVKEELNNRGYEAGKKHQLNFLSQKLKKAVSNWVSPGSLERDGEYKDIIDKINPRFAAGNEQQNPDQHAYVKEKS